MGTKKMKKTVAVIIATATVCGMTAGCTPKEEKIEVNASTSPYEDMVDYFEQEGFILEDCEPVDINETTGYLTDNTNGEFTETKVADKAYDYDGLCCSGGIWKTRRIYMETMSLWLLTRER